MSCMSPCTAEVVGFSGKPSGVCIAGMGGGTLPGAGGNARTEGRVLGSQSLVALLHLLQHHPQLPVDFLAILNSHCSPHFSSQHNTAQYAHHKFTVEPSGSPSTQSRCSRTAVTQGLHVCVFLAILQRHRQLTGRQLKIPAETSSAEGLDQPQRVTRHRHCGNATPGMLHLCQLGGQPGTLFGQDLVVNLQLHKILQQLPVTPGRACTGASWSWECIAVMHPLRILVQDTKSSGHAPLPL